MRPGQRVGGVGALAWTPYHVFDHEMARGEGDGVGGGGDGQHEGVGAADGGGDHEVERVDGHPGGLAGTESVSKSSEDSLENKVLPPPPPGHGGKVQDRNY